MADLKQLVREAPFSFVGTVEHLGAGTMRDVPIDERTAVVHIEYVLHAPDAFKQMAGHQAMLQLKADADPPKVGESYAFFAEGLAFGEGLALSEIGRLPVDQVEPHLAGAAEAGEPAVFGAVEREIQADALKEHAGQADAIVLGRVVKLEKAPEQDFSEHKPDWWIATLNVVHVERGSVQPGELHVLYANSLDVAWRAAPKPKAAQGGMWILHATQGDLASLAPFQLLHPEDFRPTQDLDTVRGNGG
jgi:hypothetical protein